MIGETDDFVDILRRFVDGPRIVGGAAHDARIAAVCVAHGVEARLGWMRTVFLVQEIPSWTRNRSARVVRRPKLHLSDLRHVAALRDRLDTAEPGAFRAGILLHAGPDGLTLGDRLHSAPIDTLWQPRP